MPADPAFHFYTRTALNWQRRLNSGSGSFKLVTGVLKLRLRARGYDAWTFSVEASGARFSGQLFGMKASADRTDIMEGHLGAYHDSTPGRTLAKIRHIFFDAQTIRICRALCFFLPAGQEFLVKRPPIVLRRSLETTLISCMATSRLGVSLMQTISLNAGADTGRIPDAVHLYNP